MYRKRSIAIQAFIIDLIFFFLANFDEHIYCFLNCFISSDKSFVSNKAIYNNLVEQNNNSICLSQV